MDSFTSLADVAGVLVSLAVLAPLGALLATAVMLSILTAGPRLSGVLTVMATAVVFSLFGGK